MLSNAVTEQTGPPGFGEPGGLASLHDFWAHWGFSPWEWGALRGVARRQRFVKDGLLGRVAEYYAWDGIVWACGGPEERETLWRALRPQAEVLTQRFVFLLSQPWERARMRSFSLGFKGYAEFHAYWPWAGMTAKAGRARDLTGLVDIGLRLLAGAQGAGRMA